MVFLTMSKNIAQTIASEVRAFGAANTNPELVRKYSKYFREGFDAYGLDYKDPQWAAHRDDWIERLRKAGRSAYLDAGDLLTQGPKYEDTSFAIEFAVAMRDAYTPEAFRRIARWFETGIRNWAHTDLISGSVLAPFLIDGVVGLDAIAAWRTSPHKFQRRAVPVTLITLIKSRTDYKALLEIVEPLMHDPEREVHQGLGWFLREVWKKDEKLVERFLLRYKDTAPRLIIQYATEKMTPAQKQRFRRERPKLARAAG
jgi:3-methyladenine DNA glycosylase AlkD